MKTAHEILQTMPLATSPKAKSHRLIYELLHFLPPLLRENTLFWYIRGDTLNFVVANQALVAEYNYKQSLIKGLLGELLKHTPDESLAAITKIKAFYGSKILKARDEMKGELEAISLAELATGAFDNPLIDPKNAALLEEIRAIIKEAHARR
ncbi:MAG: hypothetical protein K6347_05915 [Campylobacterales bacterium]